MIDFGGTVVVVDDQDTARLTLEDIIEGISPLISIVSFKAASEALSWLQTNEADLVITDYLMPNDLDGLELLQRLRGNEATSSVPVMLVTGGTVNKTRALELGAIDYLERPLDEIECRHRIRNVLTLQHGNKRLAATLKEMDALRARQAAHEEQLLVQAREEAKKATQRATQAKNLLVAKVSHEFRTPLVAIISTVELLDILCAKMPAILARPLLDALRRLRVAAEQLLRQAEEFGNYVAAEAGQLEPRPTKVELRTFLDDILAPFASVAQKKGLRVQTTAPKHVVEVDGMRLRQVVSNLVSNAVKYTAAGEVRASLELVNSGSGAALLTVVVSDTGVGIPENLQATVFDPWVRGDAASSQAGMGLGLSIVRPLVESLGGTIDLVSSENVGTKVTVVVPVELSQDGTGPEEATPKLAAVSQRILIVDDNDSARQSLHDVLVAVGARVSQAANGQAALTMLEHGQFDVVLLDLQMPHADGYDVARQITERQSTPMPRLVAMSAYDLDPTRRSLFSAFVPKPTRLKDIVAALNASSGPSMAGANG